MLARMLASEVMAKRAGQWGTVAFSQNALNNQPETLLECKMSKDVNVFNGHVMLPPAHAMKNSSILLHLQAYFSCSFGQQQPRRTLQKFPYSLSSSLHIKLCCSCFLLNFHILGFSLYRVVLQKMQRF